MGTTSPTKRAKSAACIGMLSGESKKLSRIVSSLGKCSEATPKIDDGSSLSTCRTLSRTYRVMPIWTRHAKGTSSSPSDTTCLFLAPHNGQTGDSNHNTLTLPTLPPHSDL